MQDTNNDLFLFSRETLNRVIALSEMKKKDFYSGVINPSSLTFIANGQQEWTYVQVKKLASRLKKVRQTVNDNVEYCKAICRNDWSHLKNMRAWDHKIVVKEVQKPSRYICLPELLSLKLNNPEKFELVMPYVLEETRLYQSIKIDEIVKTVCEYQKKFEKDLKN